MKESTPPTSGVGQENPTYKATCPVGGGFNHFPYLARRKAWSEAHSA